MPYSTCMLIRIVVVSQLIERLLPALEIPISNTIIFPDFHLNIMINHCRTAEAEEEEAVNGPFEKASVSIGDQLHSTNRVESGYRANELGKLILFAFGSKDSNHRPHFQRQLFLHLFMRPFATLNRLHESVENVRVHLANNAFERR